MLAFQDELEWSSTLPIKLPASLRNARAAAGRFSPTASWPSAPPCQPWRIRTEYLAARLAELGITEIDVVA